MKPVNVIAVALLAMLVAAQPAAAKVPDSPDALVKELYDKWLNQVRSQRDVLAKDKRKLYQLADELSSPYIDYARLSRLVLGKYWRAASEAQRTRFKTEFKNHLVRTYATALFGYIDADFVFKPSKYKPGDTQVQVRTETRPKDGRPKLSVNYILFNNGNGWQAMDVVIEGISVVATLRNIVRAEVQNKSLDGVIEELAEKNRKALL